MAVADSMEAEASMAAASAASSADATNEDRTASPALRAEPDRGPEPSVRRLAAAAALATSEERLEIAASVARRE